MSIETMIYLSHMFGEITTITSVILILILLSTVTYIIVSFISEREIKANWKSTKNLILAILILSTIDIVTPDEKTIYMMMGAHYLKKSAIPTKVEMIINKKLDEYLVNPMVNKDKL